jgi:predicted MPP superfamily phosphohydrolase
MKSQKRYLRYAIAVVLLTVLTAAFLVFAHHQNNNLVVTRYAFESNRVSSLDIVHISDLHGKQFGEGNQRLFDEIAGLQPDLIVFTGDMIDSPRSNVEETIQFMGELTRLAPVLGVMGNHEARSGIREEFKERLTEEGVHVLDNELVSLSLDAGMVNVLGFDENNLTRRYRATHVPLLEELEQMPGLRIVLSHYVHEYSQVGEASFDRFDFDLMFAGHAHGGQWILPGIGGLYAPGQGIAPEHYRGFYENRLVANAGLGNSHFPLRLFNFPEVVQLQVNP